MTRLTLDALLASRQTPRWQFWYALTGFLLAVACPTGTLLLRMHETGPITSARVIHELQLHGDIYIYVTLAAAMVFTAFGFVAGQAVAETAALSRTDGLTKLNNTRALAWRLEAETARAARHGEPLALLLVDVDHLKELNDEHGHAAGDRALRLVAATIAGELRGSDFAARKGGDEFAVLAPATDEESASRLAQRFRDRLRDDRTDREQLQISISVGVAALQVSHAGDASRLLLCADQALYWAKRRGRDCVSRYSSLANFPTLRHTVLQTDIDAI